MKESTFLLITLFCQGRAFLGSPDSRNRAPPEPAGRPGLPGAAFKCPPTGLHHFSGPTCDSFFECIDGVSNLHECREGMLYDRDMPSGTYPCNDAANVNCTDLPFRPPLPSQPPVCPNEAKQHLPDPDSCSAFYECRGGLASLQHCPEGLLYNAHSPPARYPCDYHYNVVCPAPPSHPSSSGAAVLPPQDQPHTCKSDQPSKVYNFYSYVTNNW